MSGTKVPFVAKKQCFVNCVFMLFAEYKKIQILKGSFSMKRKGIDISYAQGDID